MKEEEIFSELRDHGFQPQMCVKAIPYLSDKKILEVVCRCTDVKVCIAAVESVSSQESILHILQKCDHHIDVCRKAIPLLKASYLSWLVNECHYRRDVVEAVLQELKSR